MNVFVFESKKTQPNSTSEAKASSQHFPTKVPSLECWLWEVEKDLAKDQLRLIIRTDSGNDPVHVDAKA